MMLAQQQHFIQFANNLGLFYPQLAELFSVGNNTKTVSYKKKVHRSRFLSREKESKKKKKKK